MNYNTNKKKINRNKLDYYYHRWIDDDGDDKAKVKDECFVTESKKR